MALVFPGFRGLFCIANKELLMTRTLILAFCSCWLALVSAAPAADEIVPVGSEWKWLHPTDGVDPASTNKDFHKTFMKADFDDSKWNTAKDSAGPNGGFA